MNKPQTGVLMTGVTLEEEQAAREKELGRRLVPSLRRVKGPKEALALHEMRKKEKKKKRVSKKICSHCGQPIPAKVTVPCTGIVRSSGPKSGVKAPTKTAIRRAARLSAACSLTKRIGGSESPVGDIPLDDVFNPAEYRRNLKEQRPMFRRLLKAMDKKAKVKKTLAKLRRIKVKLS